MIGQLDIVKHSGLLLVVLTVRVFAAAGIVLADL